ncbi:MAG: hypothetical protein IJK64_00410 [Clostridia bacterium]|nr:hypothetical protein [Clostridia bacterium]
MKRIRLDGMFFACLALNLLMNAEWLLPAAVLLVLHFLIGLALKWALLALLLWPAVVLLKMWILGKLIAAGKTEDPPKENKNPYSVGKK